ncbi:MAG: hypothetical protein M9953_12810 [Thermomicrobiales bacterium]|nr:hypothetical protein [Thermomicrobiales bacterium]MCO5226212.1 hypothetical protein [Thermomicrobiales bacterium]MCO5228316.1 hypothetical protein [Thermomicrobiales bacterium]
MEDIISEETFTPTPPETVQPISASEADVALVQLALPDIEAMIREAVAEAFAAAPQIPAGGNTPYLIDADSLPTSEKIRRGLAMHTQR